MELTSSSSSLRIYNTRRTVTHPGLPSKLLKVSNLFDSDPEPSERSSNDRQRQSKGDERNSPAALHRSGDVSDRTVVVVWIGVVFLVACWFPSFSSSLWQM
jgi:hypothetical protein